MNINSQARIWREAQVYDGATPPGAVPFPTVAIDSFEGAKLTFAYLTPHPEDLLPPKNAVGFLEMPRYLTAGQGNIAALGTASLNTQTIQLNQIPDKLLLLVRRKNLTVANSDSFCPIQQVSVNFNNQSGILASATQQKLWLMSVENGIRQSWLEWSGQAHIYNASVNGGVPVTPYPPLASPLVGGILCLAFGKDINLSESYYSPGSIGTFQLQIRLTCFNQDPTNALSANDYEIVLITLNSGVFVLERGTASTYTAILTKQDVLDASSKPAYFHSDVDRIVGAGLMDNLKSVVGHAMDKNSDDSASRDVGAGISAAGMSAAGMSGAASKMARRLLK